MTQDGWPDASEFPYPARIRIRYAHQLDLEVLSIVQNAAAHTLATELATRLVTTITSVAVRVAKAGAGNPVLIEEAASRTNFTTFQSALFDDDLCPRWPWPWPPPPPWWRHDPNPQPWFSSLEPSPLPWRVTDPSPQPWHEFSLVAGVRALTSARAALGALVDRSAAEQVDVAIAATLDQLAG